MGNEWYADRRAGEMCIRHRLVLKADGIGNGHYVMVSCDSRCASFGSVPGQQRRY